ncbi:MAG: Wzz/FepE/Etk N-terminal domain-containing protein [Acutalibacteraceae bacterium]|jgi:capsular polysaccharide biosynthesis protein|nr:Wzz/FepE/Etk N-terminal domain-containing protein [Acutalibacteraceae bacterium]
MGDNKEIVFDLTVLLKAIKKNILPLILATVIFGVGSFFGTQYLMEKQYKASAMIIVNNKASEASGFNSAEIVAAQDLASVYSIIIKSDTVIDKVIKNLKLNMTYEQLVGAITVTPVNSTQVIQISMVGNNASDCKDIVAEVVKVAKPIISDTVETGSVKDISKASIANNGNPVGPSAVKNSVLAAFLGFALVMMIIIVKEFFNKKFKSEDDIDSVLNLPVIGTIPAVERKEFSK